MLKDMHAPTSIVADLKPVYRW